MSPILLLALLGQVGPGARATVPLNGQTFTIPAGFTLELVAGPPLVDRPIVADFDESGHLYVADSSGLSSGGEDQLKQKPHRILRLEDSDGDGRFDRRTIFADRMMFPEGALWFGGSLYVGAPPTIWKLTDRDGDGVADERVEWMNGKTLTHCANDLHGPYLGPDGWIYWAKGAFAQQTHEREGRKPFVTRAAHIFRARPDGSGVEPVMTGGMDNPVEVAFSSEGERFFSTTFFQHPEVGRRDGLIHAIYGGVYGKDHDVLDGHPRTGDLMPVLVHLGAAAPCGLARLESTGLGPEYRGNLVLASFNLHRFTRHVLTPEGASFSASTEDLVVSDSTDFHPTDVVEDADGSLLLVDTGGWYKVCCPTSQLAKPDILGAIYRLRRSGQPAVKDPRGLTLGWKSESPLALVARLEDPRPAVRERAAWALAAAREPAIPGLVQLLREGKSASVRLAAVWALTKLDLPAAREAARAALRDADDSVRHAAVHAAGVWRDRGAEGDLLVLLRAGPPQIRRAAAEALGRLQSRGAVPLILEALAGLPGADRALEHSLIFALIEIGDSGSLRPELSSQSARRQRCALLALEGIEGPAMDVKLVIPLLESSDPAARGVAAWVAQRHPDWGGALAGWLGQRLAVAAPDRVEALGEEVARFAGSGDVQRLLSSLVAGPATPPPARQAALHAMARAGLRESPSGWVLALLPILAGKDAKLASLAISVLRASPPGAADAADAGAALVRVANAAGATPDQRIEALGALPGDPRPLDSEVFASVLGVLRPSEPLTRRDGAARALLRARLDPAQLRAVLAALKDMGPVELHKVLPVFDASQDAQLGLDLVGALEEAPAASALPADHVRQRLAKYPEAVKARAVKLLASLEVDADRQRARLEELAPKVLKGGDVRRGQAVFNGTKAACSTCHAIGYAGGRVGPDLTKIGEVRTERDLLESVVFPSLSFVRSYEPWVVVTRAGEVHNGLLKKDTVDEVILQTSATAEVRVARSEIQEIRPGTTSIMPQGLDQQLTVEELRDLIAFLKGTRWGA